MLVRSFLAHRIGVFANTIVAFFSPHLVFVVVVVVGGGGRRSGRAEG